jgi:hypothetical protein
MAGDKIVLVAKGGPGGGPMVPDYEAQSAGVRRFIGRRLDRSQGKPFVDPETKEPRRHAVFVPHAGDEAFVKKDVNSQFAMEYLVHLRHGDLLPGDEETARWAGVKWDPTVLEMLAPPAPPPPQAPSPPVPPAPSAKKDK